MSRYVTVRAIVTFPITVVQDYGGSPTLFGVASVINHISEIFAYFFSFKLIRQMGHVKVWLFRWTKSNLFCSTRAHIYFCYVQVLCLGLIGNILRFLYISWLKNPWWVLPFEFMQGEWYSHVIYRHINIALCARLPETREQNLSPEIVQVVAYTELPGLYIIKKKRFT